MRRRLGRLAGIYLVLVLACVPQPAMAADAVDIAAMVGFTDTFQTGRWAPLSVTVTNHGGDLTGELEVLVTGGDELRGRPFVTSYRRKLELHRNSRKTVQFTVFPQNLSHPLVIRVRSRGRDLSRAEVDLRSRLSASRLLLVLSRDANLDYLNDGAAGLQVLYPHPEQLPVHWRGYDAVAAIVVHGVSLERLSESQFDALHKWIAQGGILAVSGGPDYTLLRSPRLAALLPALPVGMMRMDAGALQSAFSASLDISRPVHVNRLGGLRGQARLRADGVALIVERALGTGRVLYLTFDVASHPFDRWDGMSALWLNTLRLSLEPAASSGVAEPAPENPLPALIRAESASFPPPATVFLFLALYLGLLLAGYRIPARGTRLRWLTPFWSWAAPVVFAPAAWLLFGPTTFPRNPTAVAVAVIEPLPDSIYARLKLDVGVYASRNGALHLEYRGAEPVLYPSRRAQRQNNAEDWVLGEGPQRFLEPRDRRRYVLHALEGEDVIAFHLDTTVYDETAGPRVVLENASGRMLEGLWLLFGGYAYELGTIADGARVERAFTRRAHGVEVGAASWRRVLRPPPGAPGTTLEPIRIVLERWSRETSSSGYPGPGHAILLGYTATPFLPAGASSGWPRVSRALVAFRIAASAGAAAAGKTGTGPRKPDDGNHEYSESPRASDAVALAAAK